MKTRTAIAVGVFILGFLICVGSVGNLDYIDACGEEVTDSDFIEAVIRSAIGLICMAVSLIIGSKLQLEDNGNENTDTVSVSGEAEQLKNLGCSFVKLGDAVKTSTETMTKLTDNIRDLAAALTAIDGKAAQHKEEHHG